MEATRRRLRYHTARTRRGRALSRRRPSQRGGHSTAGTHVGQHRSLPATMTQGNSGQGSTAPQTDLRTNICSSRGTFQWQCLLVCLILARTDSPAAATTARPVPSLIVFSRQTLRPSPPSRPTHTLLVTAKISHILAPFFPLGGRGGERLRGGDVDGLFFLAMRVTSGSARPVSTHRPRTPLESFEIIDRHLQTVACSSCAY